MNATQDPAARLDDTALDQLFREARSFSKWQDKPVSPALIEELYDLLKLGPTSANTSPARFLFLVTPEAKARLVPLLPEMNQDKARTAPVVAIVAYDLEFYHKLDKLMPFRDIKPWFAGDPAQASRTAIQSGTLQGAYLMLAARPWAWTRGPCWVTWKRSTPSSLPERPCGRTLSARLGMATGPSFTLGCRGSTSPKRPRRCRSFEEIGPGGGVMPPVPSDYWNGAPTVKRPERSRRMGLRPCRLGVLRCKTPGISHEVALPRCGAPFLRGVIPGTSDKFPVSPRPHQTLTKP